MQTEKGNFPECEALVILLGGEGRRDVGRLKQLLEAMSDEQLDNLRTATVELQLSCFGLQQIRAGYGLTSPSAIFYNTL